MDTGPNLRSPRNDPASPETALAERIAEPEALLGKRDSEIKELNERIAALDEKVEDLEAEVDRLEVEAEEGTLVRLGHYRSLLGELDALFVLRWLPFGLRLQLDDFEDRL